MQQPQRRSPPRWRSPLTVLLGKLLFSYERSGGVIDQGVEKALHALIAHLQEDGVSMSERHAS